VNNCFKKDIFFQEKIYWNKKNLIKEEKFKKMKFFLEKNNFGKLIYVKKRLGLETNSHNFKIKVNKHNYLLKKWSKKLKVKEINSIIKLNQILSKKKALVPKIIKINGYEKLKIDQEYWTLYNFFTYYHYSGLRDEFFNLSLEIGKFYKILKKIHKKNKIQNRFKYYDHKNKKIFLKMKKIRKNWKSIFGVKLAKIVNENFKLIEDTYISNSKITNAPIINQFAHFDLHPHNIMVKRNKVISFLDIESCKQINAGYALAFCCLKICKQTILKNKIKDFDLAKNLVKIFIKNISKNYPEINSLFPYFFYFSTSEVLRRILIIFDQNLKGINDWNKVLDIQINHIKEARILFKN
jgi:hypothetical protein